MSMSQEKEKLNHPEILSLTKEVEKELGQDGRILVRPSGTQNLLRVMVEATTDDLALNYANRIADKVKELYGIDN